MFNSMLRLVEQQLSDGEVTRAEFDPPPTDVASLTPEQRQAAIVAILASTPERHRFWMADGQQAIVFFDQRARAVAAPVFTLDDDMLIWIMQSKSLSGGPLPNGSPAYTPGSGAGYPQPVQEDASFKLTPKNRTAIEKFVFSKFPPDSKTKRSGRMQVMVTGDVAKTVGTQSYTLLYLDAIPCDQLVALAQTQGYKGAVEKMEEAVVDPLGPVRRSRDFMDPTLEIYTVAAKDMNESDFSKWLSKNRIRGKITKVGGEFTVTAE